MQCLHHIARASENSWSQLYQSLFLRMKRGQKRPRSEKGSSSGTKATMGSTNSNPYLIFLDDYLKKARTAHTGRRFFVPQHSSIAAEVWNNMSVAERSPFLELANECVAYSTATASDCSESAVPLAAAIFQQKTAVHQWCSVTVRSPKLLQMLLPLRALSSFGVIVVSGCLLCLLSSSAAVQFCCCPVLKLPVYTLYLKVYWRTRVAKHSSIATEIVSERVLIQITVQFLDDQFPPFPVIFLDI
ncbi:hypothetical protein RHGRI_024936 [Rhododendron griersonianum]|uniref:HMG box domain-containing protein n=1 Tax=Rhododendron griersonianum TaxID=479676 RepID=A0AAV6JE38_9ERIC|nr:hypothetical protein RHGRI_024936 [Rhododendron griersonianum]